MTTTLLLIRHGKRATNPKTSDRDCPISDEGRKATQEIAEKLQLLLHDTPTAVYYSPTRRTQETAEIIAQVFGLEAIREQALYFGQDEDLLFQKLPLPELGETVIFVGHGPSLGMFADLSTGGKVPVQGEMPESSVMILEFSTRIGAGQARFVQHIL